MLLELALLVLVAFLPVLNLDLELVNALQVHFNLGVEFLVLLLSNREQVVQSALFAFDSRQVGVPLSLELLDSGLLVEFLLCERLDVQLHLLLEADVVADVALQLHQHLLVRLFQGP